MNRAEFNRIGKEEGYDFSEVTDEMYGQIEYVYQWHPAISDDSTTGKRQVANLFGQFGIAIIEDMTRRAKQAELIRSEITKHRGAIRILQEQLRNLAPGPGAGKDWTEEDIEAVKALFTEDDDPTAKALLAEEDTEN